MLGHAQDAGRGHPGDTTWSVTEEQPALLPTLEHAACLRVRSTTCATRLTAMHTSFKFCGWQTQPELHSQSLLPVHATSGRCCAH